MKKFLQVLALSAIAAGAYFVTTSTQPVADSDSASVEMQAELISSAMAQPSNSHECYLKCNQPCYRCEKPCGNNMQCRSDCYAQADACARTYGFKGRAHGGNTCNNACM